MFRYIFKIQGHHFQNLTDGVTTIQMFPDKSPCRVQRKSVTRIRIVKESMIFKLFPKNDIRICDYFIVSKQLSILLPFLPS